MQQTYPLSTGFKRTIASQNAAQKVDADPERLLRTQTEIAIAAYIDPGMCADDIANILDQKFLYIRPRVTDLIDLRIVEYGAKKTSGTCGRSAHTLRAAPYLVELLGDIPEDEWYSLTRALILELKSDREKARITQ